MTNLTRCLCLVLVAPTLLSAACGGGSRSTPSAGSAPPAASTGEIRQLTQAQANVSHYKTADGMYGMVIDRSGPKPKVQLDGQKDIIELTVREERVSRSGQGPAGSLLGYLMLTPDGTRLLYVGVDGDVHYLRGKDDLWMNTDKPAGPLGAATVTGAAPEPVVQKSPVELIEQSLSAIAARTKLPQYTSDDAADLGKVAAAMNALDAPSFVHYEAGNGRGGKFAPVPRNWQDAFVGDAAKSKTGLGKYNATVFPILELNDDASALKIAGVQVSRVPEPPADKMPGIVWEVVSGEAVFVTLDGGRYLLSLSSQGGPPLAAGVPPAAQWPAPLQHSALAPPTVASLAALGQLPKKMADDADAAQDAWGKCARGQVSTIKPQLEAITRENLTYSTKRARMKDATEKWQASTKTKCAAKASTMETVLVAATEARNKARLDMLEKSKARLAALSLLK